MLSNVSGHRVSDVLLLRSASEAFSKIKIYNFKIHFEANSQVMQITSRLRSQTASMQMLRIKSLNVILLGFITAHP